MTATSGHPPEPATAGERTHQPRRAPNPDQRQRDADRTRQALLSAALDEFAKKGFDAARIQDIAAAAGVNKQLIGYYFGGKEGLYQAIQRGWRESEAHFADPGLPLDEVTDRYLAASMADPRAARLMMWDGLTGKGSDAEDEAALESDMTNLRQAKERGDIAADLDPAFVRMAIMSIVMAPVVLPRSALAGAGIEVGSTAFEEYYREQLRRLVRRLGEPPA